MIGNGEPSAEGGFVHVSFNGKRLASASVDEGEGKSSGGNEEADRVEGGIAMVVVRLGKRRPRIAIQGARRPR